MFSRSKKIALSCLTLCLGIYVYTTPIITILTFRSLIQKNDFNQLDKFIDYASVRNSLKPQLNIIIGDTLPLSHISKSISNLGLLILDPLIDRILTYTVSARGLTVLLSTGNITNSPRFKFNKTNEDLSSNDKKLNIKYFYRSFNTFVLMNKLNDGHDEIETVWQRVRLTGWKLKEVNVPKSILRKNINYN